MREPTENNHRGGNGWAGGGGQGGGCGLGQRTGNYVESRGGWGQPKYGNYETNSGFGEPGRHISDPFTGINASNFRSSRCDDRNVSNAFNESTGSSNGRTKDNVNSRNEKRNINGGGGDGRSHWGGNDENNHRGNLNNRNDGWHRHGTRGDRHHAENNRNNGDVANAYNRSRDGTLAEGNIRKNIDQVTNSNTNFNYNRRQDRNNNNDDAGPNSSIRERRNGDTSDRFASNSSANNNSINHSRRISNSYESYQTSNDFQSNNRINYTGKIEFHVLYTHQKTKKKKTWKDGRLSIAGTRGSLYEASPLPGSACAAIDTLDMAPGEARSLRESVQEGVACRDMELESEKFLITVDGPWVAPSSTSGTGTGNGRESNMKNNNPLWNKQLPQSNSTVNSTSSHSLNKQSASMKKILSSKFRIPQKIVPIHPEERRKRQWMERNGMMEDGNGAWKKRNKPLQPGELERMYYGGDERGNFDDNNLGGSSMGGRDCGNHSGTSGHDYGGNYNGDHFSGEGYGRGHEEDGGRGRRNNGGSQWERHSDERTLHQPQKADVRTDRFNCFEMRDSHRNTTEFQRNDRSQQFSHEVERDSHYGNRNNFSGQDASRQSHSHHSGNGSHMNPDNRRGNNGTGQYDDSFGRGEVNNSFASDSGARNDCRGSRGKGNDRSSRFISNGYDPSGFYGEEDDGADEDETGNEGGGWTEGESFQNEGNHEHRNDERNGCREKESNRQFDSHEQTRCDENHARHQQNCAVNYNDSSERHNQKPPDSCHGNDGHDMSSSRATHCSDGLDENAKEKELETDCEPRSFSASQDESEEPDELLALLGETSNENEEPNEKKKHDSNGFSATSASEIALNVGARDNNGNDAEVRRNAQENSDKSNTCEGNQSFLASIRQAQEQVESRVAHSNWTGETSPSYGGFGWEDNDYGTVNEDNENEGDTEEDGNNCYENETEDIYGNNLEGDKLLNSSLTNASTEPAKQSEKITLGLTLPSAGESSSSSDDDFDEE